MRLALLLVALQATDGGLEVGGHSFARRTLDNGLEVLAARDPAAESVSVFVVYGVGQRMEGAATTGLAHLVEHAMYAGTVRTAAGEHDAIVRGLGGESNAFTRRDVTVYFDHGVPAGELERVLALEADRMRGLTFEPAAFEHERERLRHEEAATRGEDVARAELLESVVFRAHPYGAGVRDADGHTRAPWLSREAARHFYDTWYHPDRAAVVVVGAVEPGAALDAVERAFGELPAGPPAPPFPAEPEDARGGEARFASTLPRDRVVAAWIGPDEAEDRLALGVLADALSELEVPDGATLEAGLGGGVDRDLLWIAATGPDARAVLEDVLARASAGEIDDADLERARERAVDDYRELELQAARPYFTLAVAVGAHAALGTFEDLARYEDRVRALAPADLRAAAARWLDPERRWTVTFLADPAAGDALPDDPAELARAAQDAAEGGDLDRAIAAYEKLLEGGPNRMNTVIYLYYLGSLRREQGDLAGAERDLQRALDVVDYPAVRELLEEVQAERAQARADEPAPRPSADEGPGAPRAARGSGARVVGVDGAPPPFADEAEGILAELEAWRGLAFLRDLPVEEVEPEGAEDKLRGWYEPATGRLVVVAGASEAFARGTMLHEMFHALQDQHFDLARLHALAPEGDAARALTALIEGEAMLAVSELLDYDFERHAALPDGPLDDARFDKLFHYGAGSRFVRALRDAGGWELVARAFREPPTSTMEVYHPDRWLAGQRPLDGEALARAVVDAGLDAPPAEAAARGEHELRRFLARAEATRPRAEGVAARLAGDLAWDAPGGRRWALYFHDELAARELVELAPAAGATSARRLGERGALLGLEDGERR